jgi:anti-sigma B factor antagonist
MKLQIQNGTLTVSGVQELGANTAHAFRDQVRAALTKSCRVVEIDLSRTSFVDSCGLGALIAILKSARGFDAAVRLLNPTASIQQILEMTRLHRLFEVVNSADVVPPGFDLQAHKSSGHSPGDLAVK